MLSEFCWFSLYESSFLLDIEILNWVLNVQATRISIETKKQQWKYKNKLWHSSFRLLSWSDAWRDMLQSFSKSFESCQLTRLDPYLYFYLKAAEIESNRRTCWKVNIPRYLAEDIKLAIHAVKDLPLHNGRVCSRSSFYTCSSVIDYCFSCEKGQSVPMMNRNSVLAIIIKTFPFRSSAAKRLSFNVQFSSH